MPLNYFAQKRGIAAFHTGNIKKIYVALVHGWWFLLLTLLVALYVFNYLFSKTKLMFPNERTLKSSAY